MGKLPLGWRLRLGSTVKTAIVKNYLINQHESICDNYQNFKNNFIRMFENKADRMICLAK